jgi:hypothetical protein
MVEELIIFTVLKQQASKGSIVLFLLTLFILIHMIAKQLSISPLLESKMAFCNSFISDLKYETDDNPKEFLVGNSASTLEKNHSLVVTRSGKKT